MKYDDLDYISEDLVYQAVLCTEREESFRGVTGKEVKNEGGFNWHKAADLEGRGRFLSEETQCTRHVVTGKRKVIFDVFVT